MKFTWFSDDDWVIAREFDSNSSSEISNREREIDRSLFWFELTMTVISSSRAASSALFSKSSLIFLNLLFTSLSVWFVYLHILTNLCKSVALYDSIAKAFCNSYDILFLKSSSNASWLYSSESLVNRWNSIQNVLKFLNDSICLRRLYVFNALIRRFESSKIWYKSSKIFFAMIYDLIEFLKNRKMRCFIASSSILIRTYVFCCTSIENQFAFSFNLFRITLSQSSMIKSLSSIKTDELNNFLNVTIKTITSSSMINKKIFELIASIFLFRCSTLNSRMMNIASCNLFIFLFKWLKNAACSSRMFVHVVTIKASFFFNQYFNWSKFWIWYDVEAASNSFFISFIKRSDSRRISFIDRFDDSDSTDCLFLKTIFSCIMIAFSADDFCRYDSNKYAVIRVETWFLLLDWFKITSFCRWSTEYSTNNKNESFVSFLNCKIKKINIMSRTIIR